MFDDIWRGDIHVVPSIPPRLIPKGWKIDRSFDWGSSKPFSVCWWAESNGEPFEYNGKVYGKVRGDLYMIQEWYGWNGTRNEGVRMSAQEVAQGITDREEDWKISNRCRPGAADSSIFDDADEFKGDDGNAKSIANDMSKKGVKWVAVDKGPGSRKQGWELIRRMMKNALPDKSGMREEPGIFFMDVCQQAVETTPVLPRDDKDLDDVDTESEDHIGDAIRYRVRKKQRGVTQGKM